MLYNHGHIKSVDYNGRCKDMSTQVEKGALEIRFGLYGFDFVGIVMFCFIISQNEYYDAL